MTPEEKFYQHRSMLQYSCCNDPNQSKIKAYSIHEDGYRIYCSSCCAVSDGKTMNDTITNFASKRFKFMPQR